MLIRPALSVRVLGLAALISMGLGACSTTPAPPSSGLSSGAPLPVAGYDWHLNQDEGEASLSYGIAETDDVPLDLSCGAGSGSVTILLNTAKGSPHRISLESGGDTETYRATAERSPLSDGLDLTASAPSDDPVFTRFAQLGWLAVNKGSDRQTMVATKEQLAPIQRFFEFCKSSQ